MNCLQQSICGIVIFAITGLAHGALITTNLEDATNGGGFFGVVKFQDTAANTVRITADISDPINPGLTQGDILGLWFDLADYSALSGFSLVSNANPSGILGSSFFSEDAVSNSLGGNNNINGSGPAAWDMSIEVGKNGSAKGFNQTVSFDLTWMGLNALQFEGQRVGMRVQSISGGSFKGGSSKLRNVVPEPDMLLLFGLGLLGLGLARRKRPS